eukprot:TRINITY_DN24765_c0_g2_i1.p1 TRINITY_DN24765_c0_g2~~TRINITY_DN24765_c0_g2_i1.p1  ORF type:complete len:768 (-),score=131.31 TRINITY_DN24765_c0_g2_i1:152-2455(-)
MDGVAEVASIRSSRSSESIGSEISGIECPVNDTRTLQIGRLREEIAMIHEPKTSMLVRVRGILRFMRGPGGPWIRSSFASFLFGSVIILNAVFIGIETDLNREDVEHNAPKIFWFVAESCFLAIFIIELLLRLCADGLSMFLDLWNVFDLIIVLVGVVDTWVMEVFFSDANAADNLQTLMVFRLLRLVRIARVLRILRLLRFVRELLLLVQGIFGALKALGWAGLLISIVLYVSAVIATEIMRMEYGELGAGGITEYFDPDIKRWFGSVGNSLLTLSQLMTLEGWPDIIRKTVLDHDKYYLLVFFIPFLCFTNFALLNVVTAVMVEKVFKFSEDEKVQQARGFRKERKAAIQKISKLFTRLDSNGDGNLTIVEMKRAMDSTADGAMKQFQELGIAKHDIETLFSCLDVDSNGELSVAEFIEGCLRMHGVASSKDLLRIQYDVHRTRKALNIRKLTRHMAWNTSCLQSEMKSGKGQKKAGKDKQARGHPKGPRKYASPSVTKPPSPSTSVATAGGVLSVPMAPSPLVMQPEPCEATIVVTSGSEASADAMGAAVTTLGNVALSPKTSSPNSVASGPVPSPGLSSLAAVSGSSDLGATLLLEAQRLLADVLHEQRQTRGLLSALGSEMVQLRTLVTEDLGGQEVPWETAKVGGHGIAVKTRQDNGRHQSVVDVGLTQSVLNMRSCLLHAVSNVRSRRQPPPSLRDNPADMDDEEGSSDGSSDEDTTSESSSDEDDYSLDDEDNSDDSGSSEDYSQSDGSSGSSSDAEAT